MTYSILTRQTLVTGYNDRQYYHSLPCRVLMDKYLF